ncbi:hypothetical protein B5F07_21575 [Lachnoclostridium sp. An169]|uniref:AAA family ATPase n=1 Tax=Lachnoclostridium sp. An169 TaxID=1965569 RepID=UPI000B3A86CE|nr:AAA family ATPase [Lachnoclostridium sp. An169]OUP79821.1 hypothetical protein B5F07_21575 [Lachnoclostridium sp. An169]
MGKTAGRTVAIGIQDFGDLIRKGYFYIDKTDFIREWWESGDSVTLITRPRRFGKTLNMNMLEYFFSVDYAEQGELFEGLSIWEHEEYRKIQGTYPVISLSFANVKEKDFLSTKERIAQIIADLYIQHDFLLSDESMKEADKSYFNSVCMGNGSEVQITGAVHKLSNFLYRHYKKKVIILLDEYDTPMQEAYVDGYWEEMTAFTRSLFNSTFKTNPWLERAVMTGITRVSKESVFSELNNLEVVTTTTDKYTSSFGFTEQEVFAGLDECGLGEEKELVRKWYDGFIFGRQKDIYNPWSILNFLDKGEYMTYWANTSSNSLVSKLIREGSRNLKENFECLLQGRTIRTQIDEQIVYNQLNGSERAIWSLLLASGYLKVVSFEKFDKLRPEIGMEYELALTNLEVKLMFQNMVQDWFSQADSDYNDFIKALLADDIEAMNEYMNRVAFQTFSYFDTGKTAGRDEPERFYHGFVLGLMVDLQDRYFIRSNRESGFGRYDVVLEPKCPEKNNAVIIEFKILNTRNENSLEDTVQSALRQIEEKQYAVELVSRGIAPEHIRSYGFAFQGKTVLIGSSE